MKTIVALLLVCCAVAFGADTPATMTKLMVKFESPEIPKDSFAALAKRMYRAGSQYCRIEENPDLQNGIHGLLIMNEPDVWMINRLDKSARHVVDHLKSLEDLKRPLMQLEFGREREYFLFRSAAANPGPVMQGKPTTAYTVQAGDSQLFLFTTGDPEVPVAVVRKNDKTREIFWYGEYAEVPFDAKLFARPEGVNIVEAKP